MLCAKGSRFSIKNVLSEELNKVGKLIVGSYLSKEEAVKAINVYELQGHEAKNIIVLTNEKRKESLDKLTDVAVTDDSEDDNEKPTITERLKSLFTNDTNLELNTHERLVEYGLSEKDATRCLDDVNAGMIVVLADDELRMGQAPPIDVEHH